MHYEGVLGDFGETSSHNVSISKEAEVDAIICALDDLIRNENNAEIYGSGNYVNFHICGGVVVKHAKSNTLTTCDDGPAHTVVHSIQLYDSAFGCRVSVHNNLVFVPKGIGVGPHI